MIEFLSSWAKGIGLAIVVVSILEMLLPNNKTKKYIRMVMGVYVIFNIISPMIENKELFDVNQIDVEAYSTATKTTEEVNQTSMDERIQELYVQEIEKDITKKLEEKGLNVTKCKVNAQISSEEESKITKIKVAVEKKQEENTRRRKYGKQDGNRNSKNKKSRYKSTNRYQK